MKFSDDIITIEIIEEAIDENNNVVIVPNVDGMSGSGVWTYYPNDEIKYKLCGILTYGNIKAERATAMNIKPIFENIKNGV